MFEVEQKNIEERILDLLIKQGIKCSALQWSYIPFSGRWGISTSFFQAAAIESREGRNINVPQRAQEIAEFIVSNLDLPADFHRAEAIKGYLNLYFTTKDYARKVIDIILAQGPDFGRISFAQRKNNG